MCVYTLCWAADLHKIGGLPTLLDILSNSSAPSLQWRAAEVVATCCANNPPVQQVCVCVRASVCSFELCRVCSTQPQCVAS
jgi:hypothetical protein